MARLHLREVPGAALGAFRRRLGARRFERRLRKVHRGLVRPGDVVFDIGANVGDYTKAFLALGASVVALEPDPEPLEELRRRFHGEHRVVVIGKGASDAVGTRRLYLSRDAGSALTTMSTDWIRAMKASGTFSHINWTPGDEVEVTTLDTLIAEFGLPSFVKIDVEGFEVSVVRGLSRPVPAISLETHPEYRERTFAALEYLRSLDDPEFMYVPGAMAEVVGKAMPGVMEHWVALDAIRDRLELTSPGDFGDVLVRFADARR